jgi:hypothetical protein
VSGDCRKRAGCPRAPAQPWRATPPQLTSPHLAWSHRAGTITLPADGEYVFQTASDDGSMLYIDGQLVVDNDGAHGTAAVASDPVALAAGAHAITVTFFEAGGDARGRKVPCYVCSLIQPPIQASI